MSGLEMKYFVLKPQGTDEYAQASRKAMLAYAQQIYASNAELGTELVAWADREMEMDEEPLGKDIPTKKTVTLRIETDDGGRNPRLVTDGGLLVTGVSELTLPKLSDRDDIQTVTVVFEVSNMGVVLG